MKRLLNLIKPIILSGFSILVFACSTSNDSINDPDPVDTLPDPNLEKTVYIQGNNGNWQIMRNGEPFFIKGGDASVGTEFEFKTMKEYGGNSLRLYGLGNLSQTTLDLASQYGITVMPGIWFVPENGSFDYSDPAVTTAKIEEVRLQIRLYKDHPALLAWGISNEVLGLNSSDAMYKFMNDVSVMIHNEDPNHLTSIVTIGITTNLANKIAAQIPDIDFIGVNFYAGIPSIFPQMQASQLNKPYVITEWGVNGQWEVATTPWGCPIEGSTSQKATVYRDRYNNYISAFEGNCIGSYAFFWGDILEASTWFNLFHDGNAIEPLDELSKAWTGSYPTNRAPTILESQLNGSSSKNNNILTNLDGSTYTQQISDPEGNTMTTEYIVRPYNSSVGLVSDSSHTMSYIPGITYDETPTSCKLKFNSSQDETAYRLYVIVTDTDGRTATEVFPFKVSVP